MWTVFKVFIKCVKKLLMLFFFFWLQAIWDLNSLIRDWTETSALGGKVLTTGAQSTNLLISFLIHAYILVMFTTSSKEFKLSSLYLLKIFKIFIYRIPFSSKESLPRVFLMFQIRLSGLLDSCHQRLCFSCLLSLSLPFY